MPSESNQRLALCRRCLLVDQHDRLRRIRIGIRIAQRRVCLHSSDYGKSIELLSVPTAVLDMPGEQRLVTDKANLTVCETLRDVNIGTSAFQVVAGDLLALTRKAQGA